MAAIHKRIPGAFYDGYNWLVPCTTKAIISFVFGGQEFSIDSRDLPFMPIDPDFPKGNCSSGFSSGTVGTEAQWLVSFKRTFRRSIPDLRMPQQVGDVFLKNVYMSTHVGKDQLTFAKLAK